MRILLLPPPPPFLPRPRRRYGYGLPGYLFKYLINTCNKQLTTCEWWVNFTTADRKFKYAHKECMAFTTGEVVGVAAHTQFLTLQRSTRKVAKNAKRFAKRWKRRAKGLVKALCKRCTKGESAAAKKLQRQAHRKKLEEEARAAAEGGTEMTARQKAEAAEAAERARKSCKQRCGRCLKRWFARLKWCARCVARCVTAPFRCLAWCYRKCCAKRDDDEYEDIDPDDPDALESNDLTPLVAGGSPSPGRRKKRSKSLLGRVTAGA